jgi:rhomboid protease GluP
VKAGVGTIALVVALLVVFGIELATRSVGNDASLLKLGALPDNGALHGQYWRVATYSLLHFNGAHLLVNVLLLFWVGRITESWVGTPYATAIYVSSVLSSAAVILLFHNLHPKTGATVGASGGIFGLLAAALIILIATARARLIETAVFALGFGLLFSQAWAFQFFRKSVWPVT